tara:strand:- start:117 stop:494 length:378 start_codon:yes stop_codon:yes gene_type:complete
MINHSLIIAKKSTDIDKSIIDPWSGIHAASGVLLGMLGLSNANIIFLALLWEIIENSQLGKILWSFFGWYHYEGDTAINIISDIIFVIYFSQISKKINTIKSTLLILLCLIYYKYYDLYLESLNN